MNMSFNVQPWLRQRPNFWLSEKFRMDMADLDQVLMMLSKALARPRACYFFLQQSAAG